MCVCVCTLTVETNVMVGEDDWSVALGGAPHRHVQNTMGGLDVMLLEHTRQHGLGCLWSLEQPAF